ncbi:DNA/RNA helicase [Candidatus Scalindua japonica]|uniref:RNA helicase n=1 Tax=Candidatus Scalindua japonica TaxID=1284222 RepID=A0A286TUM0_9BACT|nr:DEAD/DEAH box helicase [Candidatus Scalindua japonica]GAX59545.1 DNA/RNA helicase [Candidatus Scalindua japonica]
MEKLEKFKNLGLSDQTLKALKKKGFEEPTPIQEKSIPILLKGECDLIGQAQTGTGKTAAFGLPIIEQIKEKSKHTQVLILAPTRELAIQISDELNSLKGSRKLHIVPIYGGQSIDLQLRSLKKRVDIVVGTPGRVIDHIKRKSMNLQGVSHLVLDEADEMLNMGFLEDVEIIMNATNKEKITMLFSATMPKEILRIAKKYMKGYEFVAIKKEQLTANLTDQIYFEVSTGDKFDALCRIIDIEHDFYGLIFCRTKVDVDKIGRRLVERGYDADALHGDISQYQRETILNKFKRKRTNILVATDVAARGIDINDLTHVINFSLPQDPEYYVHRIGRTGRAGKEGTAITFVTPEEYRKLLFIKKITKADIRKEKIPNVKDIIDSKKKRIKTQLKNIIKGDKHGEYINMAQELLDEQDPETIIAALLKHSYQDELSGKSYSEIKDISVDKAGTARLFVALGKSDAITRSKLLKLLEQKANIEEGKIDDVKIFDNFSFITVPFEDAEIILHVFKKEGKGKRPIVVRAKKKKSRK